jgi:hypothetical protein
MGIEIVSIRREAKGESRRRGNQKREREEGRERRWSPRAIPHRGREASALLSEPAPISLRTKLEINNTSLTNTP